MKIITPQPFLFKGENHQKHRAVLLLHGFTSHTGDVRMLGRFLQKHGYTCLAPLYKGHGVSPEELIKTTPADWWQDVRKGYLNLQEQGYDEIALAGLSLGGVFSLKMGYKERVKAIIPMCTPMRIGQDDRLHSGVIQFARQYLSKSGLSKAEIEAQIASFNPNYMLNLLQQLNEKVRKNLSLIEVPTLIIQGRFDTMIDPSNAEFIYNNINSSEKHLNWYENSGHAVTLGPERHLLQEHILQFLEGLTWQD